MGFRRGEIRLANFNPSKGTEAGKIRPCLVIQGDMLNGVHHPSTTVIPLTSQLTTGASPLRLKIRSRGRLREDSDLMIDQIRTIDNRRLTGDALATLSGREMLQVSEYLKIVLEL
jgi:mRNA interferase MazF